MEQLELPGVPSKPCTVPSQHRMGVWEKIADTDTGSTWLRTCNACGHIEYASTEKMPDERPDSV